MKALFSPLFKTTQVIPLTLESTESHLSHAPLPWLMDFGVSEGAGINHLILWMGHLHCPCGFSSGKWGTNLIFLLIYSLFCLTRSSAFMKAVVRQHLWDSHISVQRQPNLSALREGTWRHHDRVRFNLGTTLGTQAKGHHLHYYIILQQEQ